MLIGNEYPAAALVSHDSWDGERCAGASFKAVCVYKNNYYYSDLKDAVCDGGDELFSITVVFMRDPNPLLANPALYTDKEKEYLQRFVKPYSVEDGKNQDKEQMENELDRCTWDLYRLKHKYYMKFELRWSFGLDDVTSPGFLTNGLRAQCSIC